MERDAALEAVFMPVRPPSTFEETVERLGTAIRLGLLAPGSQLPPERELAERAADLPLDPAPGADRRWSRAATWSRCAAARAAPSSPTSRRWPTRSSEPLDEGAWAVLDYRVAIETGAVLLAAERERAPSSSTGSTELVEKMAAEVEDFEEYRRTDIRFHIGVAEAAGSPRLISAMTDVQGQMSDLIALIAAPARGPRPLQRAAPPPGQGAAPRRRLARACGLMREHIEGTEHILAGLLPARCAPRPR